MANLVLNLNSYFNNTTKSTKYLYADIAAFNSLNYNQYTPCLDYTAVRNAIRNILEFRLGQRPLNPNFGNTLYTFVYEPNTQSTIDKLCTAIRTMFTGLDQRIIIHDLSTEFTDETIDAHEIRVTITYSIAGLSADPDKYTFSIG